MWSGRVVGLAVAFAAVTASAAEVRLGDMTFQLGRELGHGAHSVTYESKRPDNGQRVAIKLPRNPQKKDGFDKEINATRSAQEAASRARKRTTLLMVYGIGRHEDGRRAYVMELAPGTSVSAKARTAREAARIGMETARGARALELDGKRHNDIKPGNAALDDKTGRFRLLDLGNVVAIDDAKRPGGFWVPEPVSAGARTEVYQLGAMTYFARTGIQPGEKQPIDLAKLPEPELRSVIVKAMQKDPAARYRNAQQFMDALRPVAR